MMDYGITRSYLMLRRSPEGSVITQSVNLQAALHRPSAAPPNILALQPEPVLRVTAMGPLTRLISQTHSTAHILEQFLMRETTVEII